MFSFGCTKVAVTKCPAPYFTYFTSHAKFIYLKNIGRDHGLAGQHHGPRPWQTRQTHTMYHKADPPPPPYPPWTALPTHFLLPFLLLLLLSSSLFFFIYHIIYSLCHVPFCGLLQHNVSCQSFYFISFILYILLHTILLLLLYLHTYNPLTSPPVHPYSIHLSTVVPATCSHWSWLTPAKTP